MDECGARHGLFNHRPRRVYAPWDEAARQKREESSNTSVSIRRFDDLRLFAANVRKKSIANGQARRAARDLTIDDRRSRDAHASLAEPRMAIEKKFYVEALPAAANAINRTLATTGVKLDE
jgi:hypothetical protein